MELSSLVVPIKRDVNVSSSVPFYCHSVIFLNGVLEVYCMVFVHVFYSKTVYNERELDWYPIVCTKSGDQFALSVTSLVEAFSRSSLANNPACGKLYMPLLAWM